MTRDVSAAESVADVPTRDGAPPLLIDVHLLGRLLDRSSRQLSRDDAAGRLPAPVIIGRSKKYRYAEILEWVEAGCPGRKAWEQIRRKGR
jgi:hypothetical protein